MSADIYTKAFDTATKWRRACLLIGVYNPEDLRPGDLGKWLEMWRTVANKPDPSQSLTGWSRKGKRKEPWYDW